MWHPMVLPRGNFQERPMPTRVYLCTDAGRRNDWEQAVCLLGDGELDAALEGLGEVVLVPLRHAHRVNIHLHVCVNRARQQTRVCEAYGHVCMNRARQQTWVFV